MDRDLAKLSPAAPLLVAVADSTQKLNVLSIKISAFLSKTDLVSPAMLKAVYNAAPLTPISQATAMHCEYRGKCDSNANVIAEWLDAITSLPHLKWSAGAAGILFGEAYSIGTIESWLTALLRSWSRIVLPTLSGAWGLLGGSLGLVSRRILRLVVDSGVVGSVAEGLGAIAALISAHIVPVVAVVAAVRALIALTIVLPRHWEVVKKAMQRLRRRSVAFGYWLEEEFSRLADSLHTPYWYYGVRSGPTSRKSALLASREALQPRLELFLRSVRVNAAAAMLAAPMLVTPRTGQIVSIRPPYEVSRTASVVINSSPTITIASDCHDIEQRVLAALKEDRQAMFDQWCLELQRRQRTEF